MQIAYVRKTTGVVEIVNPNGDPSMPLLDPDHTAVQDPQAAAIVGGVYDGSSFRPVQPAQITMAQFRGELAKAGLFAAFDAVAGASVDPVFLALYQYGNAISRVNIGMLSAAANAAPPITAAQLDQVFIAGGAIPTS